MSTVRLLLLCVVAFCVGGCQSVYLVRVENQSTRAINARLERWPAMANAVLLDASGVPSTDSVSLGPITQPSSKRVYITIQSPQTPGEPLEYSVFSRLDTLPGSGGYLVTVMNPDPESWEGTQINISRE